MVTSTDIVNQAIQYYGGDQEPVTGVAPNFDDSDTGVVASKVYSACVETVGRQFGWDFARHTVALTPTGNTPPFPWSQEYSYPSNSVQVWQILPSSLADPNDPLPLNFIVANNIVNGNQTRVIHTNVTGASAVYNNNPNENTWDASFREAVVRLLASELAMGVAGRPDTSQNLLESGSSFETIAEGRGN